MFPGVIDAQGNYTTRSYICRQHFRRFIRSVSIITAFQIPFSSSQFTSATNAPTSDPRTSKVARVHRSAYRRGSNPYLSHFSEVRGVTSAATKCLRHGVTLPLSGTFVAMCPNWPWSFTGPGPLYSMF